MRAGDPGLYCTIKTNTLFPLEIIICVHVIMYVCLCGVCVCTGAHGCMQKSYMWRPEVNPRFGVQMSHTTLVLAKQVRLADQRAPETLLSLSLRCWDSKQFPSWVYYVGSGGGTQVFMVRKVSTFLTELSL